MAMVLRFRDSWLIRIGAVIIALVIVVFLFAVVAYAVFGYNPEAGPSAIWAFLWVVPGILLIAVGVGQTIVRRKRDRNSAQ
jgi:hypothetical protein